MARIIICGGRKRITVQGGGLLRRHRLVLALLLLAAISVAWPEATRDGGRPAVPNRLQALSAQAPAEPATALQSAWQEALHATPLMRSAQVSAYAYDLTARRPLAAISPTQLQIPASIMKMFTTAAALQDLGPTFTYKTQVDAAPAVLAGQAGPIYLVGGGDPWLEAQGNTGLELLAAQVARRLHSATRVVGVGSLFPPPSAGAGWAAGDLPTDYGSGANALEGELSSVELVLQAGTSVGSRVSASLQFLGRIAAPDYFRIVNTAHAVAGPSPAPNVTRLLGSETIVVSGTMQAGSTLAFNLSPNDPARFAAALFQSALAQDGVRFTGQASSGGLPKGQETVASYLSPPLRVLLPLQDRFSINQMADNLFRMNGMKERGSATAASAQSAMAAFLRQAGLGALPPQYDGSGLSPLDLESAQGVVSLLSYAASRPWFPYFRNAMMEAGNANPQVCGILCGHFVGTAAQNKVWLKTGNLANQWNYEGYATAGNGDLIAFAILEEGPPAHAMAVSYPRRSAIDQMVIDLATWPREPSAAPSASQTAKEPPSFATGVLGKLPAQPDAARGLAILDLKTGRIVYGINAQKLIRTSWLTRLGLLAGAWQKGLRAFPAVTVKADGPVRGGVLQGSLVLDGAMDPALSSQDLAALAREVRASGITKVDGPLLYVQNGPMRGDPARWPSGATWEELGQSYLPPMSNLLVDSDIIQILVQSAGGRVRVQVRPADAGIKVLAQGVTANGSDQNPLAASWSPGLHGFVLTGSAVPGQIEVLEVTAPDPGLVGATLFRDALAQAGVTAAGGIRSTRIPLAGHPLASLPGPSLASLAEPLLADPSTLDAAELSLLLGSASRKAVAGAVGTTDVVPDPTGISFGDYMTAESVVRLLGQIWHKPGEGPLRRAVAGQGVWLAEGPGTAVVADYVYGPAGTPYAVAGLESGLLWQGTFGDTIIAPLP